MVSPSTIETGSSFGTPLFIESGQRPLYAVYHPPDAASAEAPVLVHCHGVGVEQLTSFRTEVLSARAASAAGFPVFRYHSRGHGDSAGDFCDVTFDTLVEDAMSAGREAQRRSGASRIIWVGIRLGAMVAARALATMGGAGLVLWEPVHRPQDYFRSMLRSMLFSAVAHGLRPSAGVDELLERLERDGCVDVHGYYLHRPLVRSVEGLDLSTLLQGWQGPSLICQVQGRRSLTADNAALAESLERRGAPVKALPVAEDLGWLFVSNPVWECPALVRATEEWLRAVA